MFPIIPFRKPKIPTQRKPKKELSLKIPRMSCYFDTETINSIFFEIKKREEKEHTVTDRHKVTIFMHELERKVTRRTSEKSIENKFREVHKALRKHKLVNFALEDFYISKSKNDIRIKDEISNKMSELSSAQGYIHMLGEWQVDRITRKIQLNYNHPISNVTGVVNQVFFRTILVNKWITESGRSIFVKGKTRRLILFGLILGFEEEKFEDILKSILEVKPLVISTY